MSTRAIFVFAVLLCGAGCSVTDPTDPQQDVGPVIARYALTAQDGNALPCCGVDSAGVQITIVGGELAFHSPANYRDTVFTPAGPASAACVHGIPNGSFLNTFKHTLMLPDSTVHFFLSCDVGTYTMLVVRTLESGSSSTTDSITISFGNFAAKLDNVALLDSRRPFMFDATVSAPTTIVVAGPTHRYRFEPAP